MRIENQRELVLKTAEKEKIIAIVRSVESEECLKVAQALYDGGIRMMEITYNQKSPESWEPTAKAIGAIAEHFQGKMLVGAGTVTTPELVELTAKHGGLFIISPDTNETVIRATVAAGMVSMPGALTPTEIVTAHRYGADFVKLFPAGTQGTAYFKAVTAPLNHIRLLAVGGVNEKNIADFMAAGAVGAGVGGNLVNKTWIANGEFDKITALAKECTEKAGV